MVTPRFPKPRPFLISEVLMISFGFFSIINAFCVDKLFTC